MTAKIIREKNDADNMNITKKLKAIVAVIMVRTFNLVLTVMFLLTTKLSKLLR